MPIIKFMILDHELLIESYPLFACLAICTGTVLFFLALLKAGLPTHLVFSSVLMIVFGFFIGARVMNYLIHPEAFTDGFTIWTFKMANFSLYGGIILDAVGLMILIQVKRMDGWKILDAAVIPFAVAFSIARVGCFLTGCCAGKVTTSALGVHFPAAVEASDQLAFLTGATINVQLALYPTQLFELVLALIGLFAVLVLKTRVVLPTGAAFLVFSIWFSAMRWAVLYLRDYPYQSVITSFVYPILYTTMITVSGLLLLRRVRHENLVKSTSF